MSAGFDAEVAEANRLKESFIGKPCVFYDAYGKEHDALVTAVHGMDDGRPMSVNVVYVVKDAAKADQYGRQIERATSVVHRKRRAAHGIYFEMQDEIPLAG